MKIRFEARSLKASFRHCPIDSIEQTDFLTGKVDKPARESVMFFHGDDLLAIKWRNFKIHLTVRVPADGAVRQAGQGVTTGYSLKVNYPWIFNVSAVVDGGFLSATPFCGVPCCLILDRGILGRKARNMKMLIAVLAAGLTLAFVELGLGPSDAEAAANYCKHRYNLCLARCPGPVRRCFSRCQSQYRHCTYPSPYLGDLL